VQLKPIPPLRHEIAESAVHVLVTVPMTPGGFVDGPVSTVVVHPLANKSTAIKSRVLDIMIPLSSV
jgi:hypothetical protein